MSEGTTVKDGLDAIERNVLDGEGGEVKTETAGTASGSQEQKAPESKGSWVTALPQRLREGIKADEYEDLADYVSKLQEAAKQASVDEKSFAEGWDKLVSGLGDNAKGLEQLNGLLRDSRVDSSVASKIYEIMEETGKKAMEEQKAARKAETSRALVDMFGERIEERMSTANKGMVDFLSRHPNLREAVAKSGVYSDPAFLMLLAEYQDATGEKRSPDGGANGPRVDTNDPYGIGD